MVSSLHGCSHSLRALFPLWSSSCWKQQDQCGLVDCFCIPEWTWGSLLSLIQMARQVAIQGSGANENIFDVVKRLLQFIAVILRVWLDMDDNITFQYSVFSLLDIRAILFNLLYGIHPRTVHYHATISTRCLYPDNLPYAITHLFLPTIIHLRHSSPYWHSQPFRIPNPSHSYSGKAYARNTVH